MKKLSVLAAAGFMFGGMAIAGDVPVTEFVAKTSALREIVGTKPVPGLRAFNLNLNQNTEGKYTSFMLNEDNGLRCNRAPCPSTKNTKFLITDIKPQGRRDSVKYYATEVLTNIPPNVRLAPRKMEVDESSMELVAPGGGGFTRREMWQVRVTTFPNVSLYYSGTPKAAPALEEEME